MKTRIAKTMTGYNTCEISERTIHKEISKDYIKVGESTIIEGFAVYISNLIEGEDFVIETEGVHLHTGKNRKRKQIYANYISELWRQYIKKKEHNKNSLDRTTVTEFSIQIIEKEKSGLAKVTACITYFNVSGSQERFLKFCNGFISWLEKRIRTKPFM